MSSSNLQQLYRQVIMDHYKNPRNKGLLQNDGYHEVHLKNPTCGDDITVQVHIEDGIVKDLRHQGTGCSICCSSASVMSQTLKEKTIDEAKEITDNFYELVKGNDFDEDLDMGDAPVYQGVSQFPARVKCATISWKAAEQAIKEVEEK
ncbi:MAG TPA: SUF system NifU family Fe-S cluster assembly protein [Firmicutes bacterium]|nr:SUF system NifU family Fe-S cluster assembly protein [Bacillota bacterium]